MPQYADMSATLHRCRWAEGSSDLMRAYHDEEWGVPTRDGRALLELLCLEGFQAGLAWSVILNKRESMRRAFARFEPKKLARFDDEDVARLMLDAGIVRQRAKIEAAIANARAYLELEAGGERFADFAWALVGGKPLQNSGPLPSQTPLSKAISKTLKQRGFKFVGPVTVYSWMQAVGMVNDHAPDCFRRRQVAKL